MTEWFERWFGEDYLKLYPHRDDEDARRAMTLVAAHVPLAGRRVLDLACGAGRHAVQLRALGARPVGIDLSRTLLNRAREATPPFRTLVRGDMRALPFRRGSFDAVVNLFTSFGYFATDTEHADVIADLGRILAPNGDFVIDYLNPEHVRANLVGAEQTEVGGQRVAIERRIVDGGRYVCKTMHVAGDERAFVERVRLFTADDLDAMLGAAGLEPTARFGDYAGSEWSPAAPRTILFARKS